MPFCPKCKGEFRDGFTICPDCQIELVDDSEGTAGLSVDSNSDTSNDLTQKYLGLSYPVWFELLIALAFLIVFRMPR